MNNQWTILKQNSTLLKMGASFIAGICAVLVFENSSTFSTAFVSEKIADLTAEQDANSDQAPSEPLADQTALNFVSPVLPIFEGNELTENLVQTSIEKLDIEAEAPPKKTETTADQILSDHQNRISPEFQIPELIYNQTKFWFRIYTEFDSTKKVIHDALHPHIIFDVIDTTDILAQPARAKWLNVVKAEKVVSNRVQEIKNKLKKMINKPKEKMDQEELVWLAQFEGIQGHRKKIILTSIDSIRIQTGQKDFFENGLSISTRYLEEMETIFKQRGLPIELTRLPFVESSFVIGATSKVGAAGIWQFMPGIGRKFMMVNDLIDERRNPFKATEAAAKLLKENHLILHRNWGLALTAYNHGPGGVRKAMQAVGSKDIAKIVRTYRSKNFDFASANFFTCFLAALHAHTYRDLLWTDHLYQPTLAVKTLNLKKTYRAKDLRKITKMSDEQILLYNPELDRAFKHNQFIPKGYRLFLTADTSVSMKKVQLKKLANNDDVESARHP